MTANVSMFASVFSPEPRDAELSAILTSIRTGRWRDNIDAIRAAYQKTLADTGDSKAAKDSISEPKKALPVFCISGTASNRKTPLQHSGLLQIDIDGLNGSLDSLRAELQQDPHVSFGFVSPSGDGLKLGLAIDGTRHAESFEAAKHYFRQRYNLEIDGAVKDRLRLCFVSYDPQVWTNDSALPLEVTDSAPTEPAQPADALSKIVILPSGGVTISESARGIFERVAPRQSMFWRGGALVELVQDCGFDQLDIVKPEAFRSRVERHCSVFAWRSNGEGEPVLKPTIIPRDTAAALMATMEARTMLPHVSSVLRCPVIVESGPGEVSIFGRGYHDDLGGVLIVAGEEPMRVELHQAVKALKWLVDEFHFQSEGDRSRALAAFITPALRFGGLLHGNIPIDVAEADQSQAGKGFRHDLVTSLYNDPAYFVTARQGGVGSVDESFSAALIAGRPFINLDNFRGKMDSQHLEAFMTCPTLFPARIPHKGEVMIDPKRFMLQMSSNGVEATRDLINRASICRIRKRPGYSYRDTLGELKSRQSFYLSCVFSVVSEWIAQGKQRTNDTRHDFREWSQTLDWIVQNILSCAPLMDGHQSAQERASNPGLSWLRSVALALERDTRLGESMMAGELAEVCDQHCVDIPGDPKNEDESKKQIGRIFSRIFKEASQVEIDGFTVSREITQRSRLEGGSIEQKSYKFQKL